MLAEIVPRALGGGTVRGIADDLNDRGILTAGGSEWSVVTLHKVLVAARISGRRERYGVIMNEAAWPAIITPADSDRLRAMLARRPGMPRADSRRYVLSGILACGLCEAGLYGRTHPAGPRYVCVKGPGLPGCGMIGIQVAPAEQHARDKILAGLASPQFVDALLAAEAGGTRPEAAGIVARLAEIEDAKAEMARDRAAGLIDRREWLEARDELTRQADALTARLHRSTRAAALSGFAALPGTVYDRWAAMTASARRALVKATVASIPVHPATGRRGRFDPARIGAPLWRA